eukprot:TRINITY_DN2981_c0_g1_i5.p1 TRINITY_DN2981_c0_g1~~TRINITY_DN2981_c0_g1_i5.p1  ORF type:complete len:118 (-),score=20.07 TRINITY_DN2981_c0_g1_i5:254-607(-)
MEPQTGANLASDTAYSPEKRQRNENIVKTMSVLGYFLFFTLHRRIFTSLVGGCTAGILGVSGWWPGVAVYLLVTLYTSFLLAYKTQFHFTPYFSTTTGPVLEGLFSGFMVCWCICSF